MVAIPSAVCEFKVQGIEIEGGDATGVDVDPRDDFNFLKGFRCVVDSQQAAAPRSVERS